MASELQSCDVGAGIVRRNTLDAEVQDQIDMLRMYSLTNIHKTPSLTPCLLHQAVWVSREAAVSGPATDLCSYAGVEGAACCHGRLSRLCLHKA